MTLDELADLLWAHGCNLDGLCMACGEPIPTPGKRVEHQASVLLATASVITKEGEK